jgi:transcriptional regulator with XRE-family HTH domain
MPREKDITIRFGQRLRDLRTERGHSQEEFADRCGLDRTYISGIERGKRNLSLRNLAVIAEALDLTLSELMDGL